MKYYEEEGELEPCPFCGGKAILKSYKGSGLEVGCSKCHTRRRQCVIHNSIEWLREEMVKDWNTRITTETTNPLDTNGN